MKKVLLIALSLGFILLVSQSEVNAQKASLAEVRQVTSNFLRARIPGQSAQSVEPFIFSGDTIAWIAHCLPQGYLLIGAGYQLFPVVAWSTEGDFGEGEAWREFMPILSSDLATRIRNILPGSPEYLDNQKKWRFWLNYSTHSKDFQQWPPEGTTSTGGWLETNWTQSAPYNNFCPVDGNTGNRSVAGCPATAMAQIVNYHKELHDTRFNNDDDYYHNFGTGNKYWIDDDYASYDFPSWDQLNVYLDTLNVHLTSGFSLKNDDKAALTFACGVAAKQVYSSSVSGTYGINQAFDAFIRFGYEDSKLLYPEDTTLNAHLAENIKIGLPAQLGLVNPEETAGHNVVVDGYNTDEFYHFNFGWGGSANGWYTMPPTSIAYNLTVIEGIVLDINLSHPPVGLNPVTSDQINPELFFDRNSGILRIHLPENSSYSTLTIFDVSGKKLISTALPPAGLSCTFDIPLPLLNPGMYVARLGSEKGKSSSAKFIIY